VGEFNLEVRKFPTVKLILVSSLTENIQNAVVEVHRKGVVQPKKYSSLACRRSPSIVQRIISSFIEGKMVYHTTNRRIEVVTRSAVMEKYIQW